MKTEKETQRKFQEHFSPNISLWRFGLREDHRVLHVGPRSIYRTESGKDLFKTRYWPPRPRWFWRPIKWLSVTLLMVTVRLEEFHVRVVSNTNLKQQIFVDRTRKIRGVG